MARVRYLLEHKPAGGTGGERVILPNVADVQFSRPHAVVTTWTLGAHPVHHYSGIRSQKIMMSGRSGLKTRFETEGVTSETASDLSGPALFRKLEKFLEKFERDAGRATSFVQRPPELILHMLWEGKKLKVEHERFHWGRSAQRSRHSYEWSLDFESHGELNQDPIEGPLSALTEAFEVAKKITGAVNSVSIGLAKAREILDDSRTQLDQFREPVRAVAKLARQWSIVARSGRSLAEWPKAFMEDFWYMSTEALVAVFNTWDATPFGVKGPRRSGFIEVMELIAEARKATQTALGLGYTKLPTYSVTKDVQESGLAALPQWSSKESALLSLDPIPGKYTTRNGQLTRVYQAKSGDTLQSIAWALLGDRSRWIEIAELNGITSPSVFSDSGPLFIGQTILVPAATGDGALLPGLSTSDLYGTDLRLSSDGDLVAQGDGDSDVETISGVPNLRQGLINRMMTVQGDNATFPGHGLPEIIGRPNTDIRISSAAIEADAQFRRDPRISSVNELVVDDNGDELVVTAELQPVIGKAFDIAVPLPTEV